MRREPPLEVRHAAGGDIPCRERAVMRDTFDLTEQHVRRLLAARRALSEIIGPDLVSDIARGIILELTAARISGEQMTLGQLNLLGPASTVSRWLKILEERGVIAYRPSCAGTTNTHIELADPAAIKIAEALSEIWSPA